MINVNIELHSAIDGRREQLSRIEIWNDGTGTKTTGNYGYRLYGRNDHMLRSGVILGYPRRLTVPHLVYRVLEDYLGDKA